MTAKPLQLVGRFDELEAALALAESQIDATSDTARIEALEGQLAGLRRQAAASFETARQLRLEATESASARAELAARLQAWPAGHICYPDNWLDGSTLSVSACSFSCNLELTPCRDSNMLLDHILKIPQVQTKCSGMLLGMCSVWTRYWLRRMRFGV